MSLDHASPSLLRLVWKRWIGGIFVLALVRAVLFVVLRAAATLGPRSLRGRCR